MAAMNEKDYYAILGVEKDATTNEIRKAFQKRARTLHPDVNKQPDAEERFKEVSEAYAVLSDDEKRRRYDAMRSGAPFVSGGYGPTTTQGDPFSGASGFPFGWGFPFTASSNGSSTASRAYRPRAGADIVYNLTLDEQTALQGGKRGVTYQRYAACEVCHGVGSVESDHAQTCPTCQGRGRISVDLASLFGFGVVDMTCPECEGAGQVVADPCSACGGSGRVLTASELVIEIEPRSHDGDEICVKGAGNAGTNGEVAGDFVCRIGVPSEQLTRRQARGFYLLGLLIPFVVTSLVMNTLGSIATFLAVLAIVGAYMVLRDGLRLNLRWWRNAAQAAAAGVSNGVVIAIFVSLMLSCTAYRYRRYSLF